MNEPDDDFDTDEITEDDCPVWFEMGYESEEEVEKISLDKLRTRMQTW